MIEFGQGEEFAVAIEEFRSANALTRVLSLEARAYGRCQQERDQPCPSTQRAAA